ncbi:MAG TPA: S46 family peptidase [Gemmatimonadales bacterium]|nr:S46 family peptidase [Gemmatimonadales bacterium]
MLRALLVVTCLALPSVLSAQDGEYPGLETGKMWTFDVPPRDYWAKRYNFTPSDDWLAHVRLSALRYDNGCTASFVSGDGLVMTNHHCARACIESSTKQGEDFLSNGFYAARREDERACQGLYLDQLEEITDVTDRVAGAARPGADAKTAAAQREKAIKAIQDDCTQGASDAACQVITMYRGGQYKLYRFHRYTDVRLVFAPEDQTAFFGGDPDNFTYPRYDLDVSFVRAYVDGKPAVTPDHFAWSRSGSTEGELVFVIGNPGSTGRLNTMAQLEFLRDVQYPAQLDQLKRQIATYHALANADSSRAKGLRNLIFGLENAQKAIGGYQAGLLDPSLMAEKRAWEKSFRAKVDADANLKRRYGTAWQTIATITLRRRQIDARRRYYSSAAYGSRLLGLAMATLRYGKETAKPDSLRLRPYQEGNRANVERILFGNQPVDMVQEQALLTAYLTAMQRDLPPSDPVRKQALGSRTPEEAAKAMVEGATLTTADARKALVDGGAQALAASQDPFLKLARVIDPLERALIRENDDLDDREALANEQVARALLAVYGNSVAPDATFSLRISDGEVRRYPMNGTLAAPYTTFYGLYDRSAGFADAPPFDLPPRWQQHRDSLDLSTPLDGVSTNDIIGGNSGSPVINRNAQIVGLIFDGNIEMLPNRFLFTERVARSVWVDSRAIVEALRHVYGATALADELAGPPAPAVTPGM